MAKQLRDKTSPFDALKIAHISKRQPSESTNIQTVEHSDSQTSEQPATSPTKALAKSADPAYTKFTTYVRRQTHLAVKTRLVSQGRELSDLVEELLNDWLIRETSDSKT